MYYMEYSEIGNRIATKRRHLRMTQYEVEQKAGLSRKYLSNIEHGRSIPSIDVLMQIADVLHMTPNELLLGAVSRNISKPEAEQVEEEILVENIRKLPSNKQAMAKNFLDWLEEQKL